MKKITTTAFLFLAMTAAISCKSDDDSGSTPTEADLIVGTWDMTDNTVSDGNADITVNGIKFNTDFTWTGSDYDYRLNFDQEGQVNEEGSFKLNVLATILGQPLDRSITAEAGEMGDVLASGKYEVSGDMMTLDNNNQVITATIVEVTETTLRLRFDLAEVSPEAFDVSGMATGTNNVTFTRD